MITQLSRTAPLEKAIDRFMKDEPLSDKEKDALESLFKDVHEALSILRPYASPSAGDMLGVTDNIMVAWLAAVRTGGSSNAR